MKLKLNKMALLLFPFLWAVQMLPGLDISADIIDTARRFVGSPYCNGSSAPSCFDCSGFVYYIYSPHIGGLPRVSLQMANTGQPVRKSELCPGDLVFFATSPAAGVISHVAIYIGQNSIIHAISDGPNRGVNITPLNARYWRRHYHSAARLLTGTTPAAGSTDAMKFAQGIYSGELQQGEPHGQGTLELNNGDVYQGRFSHGQFDGAGTYIWKNGDRFEGQFRQGVFHGEGLFTDSDGTQVKGVWKDGKITTRSTEPRSTGTSSSASPASADLYTQQSDSPWDNWEGYVRGDYAAWKTQEEQSFEDWKRQNSPNSQ